MRYRGVTPVFVAKGMIAKFEIALEDKETSVAIKPR
jgi:hypothetical protein